MADSPEFEKSLRAADPSRVGQQIDKMFTQGSKEKIFEFFGEYPELASLIFGELFRLRSVPTK